MVRYVDLISDTICAPITAPGYAGVSIIRVSGNKALFYAKKITQNLSEKPQSHHQELLNIFNLNGEKIDQALVTYFEDGKSFTGDETIEISCHGNPLIVNEITNSLLKLGCRAAEKGEFSFRAFYNGKIDLVQAESIQQIVSTKNKKGSKASQSQLSGLLSSAFSDIEDQLINSMSHLEAMIDFVEEDIQPEDYKTILNHLIILNKKTMDLIDSYNVGKNIKEGFRVLLFGQTNAGKSSLFNVFLNDERSIVTDIHGTTRDLLRGQMFVGNNLVEFIDSAGVRQSEETIEKIGIEKSLKEVIKSDLTLFILDSTQKLNESLLEFLPTDKTIVVFNKVDLFQKQNNSLDQLIEDNKEFLKRFTLPIHFVSATFGLGINDLKAEIENQIISEHSDNGKNMITQARHFNHLNVLFEQTTRAIALLNNQESPDLISQELAIGLMEIHQILGKEYNDEILDKIFREFCIGK